MRRNDDKLLLFFRVDLGDDSRDSRVTFMTSSSTYFNDFFSFFFYFQDEDNESSEKKSAKDALLLWCQRKVIN
jgi:hypothetical protein